MNFSDQLGLLSVLDSYSAINCRSGKVMVAKWKEFVTLSYEFLVTLTCIGEAEADLADL